jgi:hypothetical protein
MGEEADAPVRRGRRKGVAYDPGLAQAICARVAAGEVLYALCREDGMPTAQSVRMWARRHADFRTALIAARRAGGRTARGGGVWSYSREVADEVFDRLCDGESLSAIGGDPAMPCLSTLFYWRGHIPEFETLVQTAKRIQAERFCDLGWDLAREATPQTAYLTHVRLTQLRWTAGVLAPRVFRLKTVEPETPAEVKTILYRHFTREVDPETGEARVAAFTPNPATGELEREDTPGWRPPPGIRLPGGGG